MNVPVCAGRGEQKPCRWYDRGVCRGFYDVVTGAADPMDCHVARGDQLLCGREGKQYESA